ncbi:MAG: preprotein translocase subunit SecY [Firmicutes bacterium]|nr:preprotein translocase subunit SecY [Bacillota bacterium]
MFSTLVRGFADPSIRKKLIVTLLLVVVYRIGCIVPVPGIDAQIFNDEVANNEFLGILSAITGGALANGAFFAMGIAPYINASIIMQLLTIALPRLQALSKQGTDGRKKIARYTRYLTLVLAIIQAVGLVVAWGDASISTTLLEPIFGTNDAANRWVTTIMVILFFTAGTAFTVWIGERITDLGIGNGISLLIFVGIIATAGNALRDNILAISMDNLYPVWGLLGFVGLLILIFALIIYVDMAQRKIPVQYAKQVKGRKMYGGQSTFIPMKINASGVLPIIFASSLVAFPSLILMVFNITDGWFADFWNRFMLMGRPLYTVVTGLLILGFAFFYAQANFDPIDVSRNIQQNGGFIPGIRPGRPTAEYLKRVHTRITLFGALFLAAVAIIPAFIFGFVVPGNQTLINAFTATGMLIVVSVALELDRQIQAQLMMKQYKGFLD